MVILCFCNLLFTKNIINKTQTTKNQENPAHHFGDNHKLSSLCKIGLNPKELELLA